MKVEAEEARQLALTGDVRRGGAGGRVFRRIRTRAASERYKVERSPHDEADGMVTRPAQCKCGITTEFEISVGCFAAQARVGGEPIIARSGRRQQNRRPQAI